MVEQLDRRSTGSEPQLGYPAAQATVGDPEHASELAAWLAEAALPEAPMLVVDGAHRVRWANDSLRELVGPSSAATLTGTTAGSLLLRSDFAGQQPNGGDRAAAAAAGCEYVLLTDAGRRVVRMLRWPIPVPAHAGWLLVDIGSGRGVRERGPAQQRPAQETPAPEPTDAAAAGQASHLHAELDELRGERARAMAAQRIAGVGYWEYDVHTGASIWSDGLFDILGLDPAWVRPSVERVFSQAHLDDRDALLGQWRTLMETGTAAMVEFRVVRPDRAVRQLQGSAASHMGADGLPAKVTGCVKDITEQRVFERQLADERIQLMEAQQIARIGSWSWDATTGAVQLSETTRQFWRAVGVGSTERDWLQAVHPAHRSRVVELNRRLRDDPALDQGEVTFRGGAGFGQIYLCRARTERDEAGQLLSLHGTIQDVTEVRELRRELEEEQRRSQQAQRLAKLGTWEWEVRSQRLRWSPMVYQLHGVDSDVEVTYQHYLSMVHPDDRDWVDQRWREIVGGGGPAELEYRVRGTEDAERVFRSHGFLHSSEGEKVLVGTTQDVTELRQVEARMRRSSRRFSDLVELAPVGVGIFDHGGRLVDANSSLCGLLGYELERLRGMSMVDLADPAEREEVLRTQEQLAAGGSRRHRVPQRTFRTSDNRAVYCELHISVSVQDDGTMFWMVIFADVTERREIARALHYRATHDELTGLPNRAAVKDQLDLILDGGFSENAAVLFCDVDNFKRINDSLGHDAGDELLVALARRLEASLGPETMVARLSGDEFVIICSDVVSFGSLGDVAGVVGSLLHTAVPLRGQLVRVTASIGAATPLEAATADDLLRFADAAMYEAKRTGHGRVSVAGPALIASADRQMHLEGQLRDALGGDELTVHYQPVVGPDGGVRSAEALVRWPHPERGLLAPGAFLPVADQGNMSAELDRWVLRAALQEAKGWPEVAGHPVQVAVNLSHLLPGDPGFLETVTAAVLEAEVSWDRLVLELVETSLVDLPSRTREVMAELVGRGVRFAVDDFGTGYSSLARLKELPAQIVKVDRQFVSGVGSDPGDFAVAKAVVDLARAMGRRCVAEGVETATQFHVLRGVGVDAYQGWLFSKAVPAREFRTVLGMGPLHVPSSS